MIPNITLSLAILTNDFSDFAHESGQQIAKLKTRKAQNQLIDKYLGYLLDHPCSAVSLARIVMTWLRLYNVQMMPVWLVTSSTFHARCFDTIISSKLQLTPYG